ncbi:MAG: hypothetical protein US60_C0022G0012 [Microgenomates group bacterium GW2011_GWC1_37_8]|uniref:Holin n=1 Tax=Candidatus Woesebacteria bacterium GW2011_GWB1_38_8 TaxID=1618570 RepID=A0A0G0NIC9_9BACT|nr:MAG: hypothetical protein US60_C0022G0012 [Microgenomates group bacterium GW2011_GWC1_37_8]KKQ85629.1 MAG: hypothetical protein UT08_C0005G0080 [Candidatus Woesebacteria bacterium GW2011_GWB1_38_8]
MKINVKEFLLSGLADAVKKLGVVGTISYVGAAAIFAVLLFTNFDTEPVKAGVLLAIGAVLLFYSGAIYWSETKQETTKIKEALGVLREVYNRMAEQISTADKDKTVSITMTIDNLPDKIAEVIKKSSKEN